MVTRSITFGISFFLLLALCSCASKSTAAARDVENYLLSGGENGPCGVRFIHELIRLIRPDDGAWLILEDSEFRYLEIPRGNSIADDPEVIIHPRNWELQLMRDAEPNETALLTDSIVSESVGLIVLVRDSRSHRLTLRLHDVLFYIDFTNGCLATWSREDRYTGVTPPPAPKNKRGINLEAVK